MENIGIFYGSLSGNTRLIAELIKSNLPPNKAEIFDIFEIQYSIINSYNNLIFGIPTWGKMEIHEDWKIFLKNLTDLNLCNKKIAIYGLGDQYIFDNEFVDAMGLLKNALKNNGCEFIGEWPVDGYYFKKSNAIFDNKFIGLVIDEDNQSELTEKRVKDWIEIILPQYD